MFNEGQQLGAYTAFENISEGKPDFERDLVISGGFLNDLASKSDAKSFVYAFDGTTFPNVPLMQPRVGSVEQWNFINNNNDEHPIHIHVNDFQVMHYFDLIYRGRDRCRNAGVFYNANVPAPAMGAGSL